MVPLIKSWRTWTLTPIVWTVFYCEEQITQDQIFELPVTKFWIAKLFLDNRLKPSGDTGNLHSHNPGNRSLIWMLWSWKPSCWVWSIRWSGLKTSDGRIFHITDSYIVLSVVSKVRSSSLQLHIVMRRLAAALLLAHGLSLVVGHDESEENPTDHESRAFDWWHPMVKLVAGKFSRAERALL